MLDEIQDIYISQYVIYCSIYDKMLEFDVEDFDYDKYKIEMQNIDFELNIIKKQYERLEQLKQIYILKNNIEDFTGDEIKKVEDEKTFSDFKSAIDALSQKIIDVKKLHDKLTLRMNKETDYISKTLDEIKKTNGKLHGDYIKNQYKNSQK
jgi:hypothetical protein